MDQDPHGIVRVVAPNPSPMTLGGTNTYVVLDGTWVVDPGPDDPGHIEAVAAVTAGEVAGIVLTHSHADHSAGAGALAERLGGVEVLHPGAGDPAGPFSVVPTPGHSPDSVCLILDRVCFTGDTVLGEGSVFINPDEGSLSAYLDSLRQLRSLDLEVLCPGHGPYVHDPEAKLTEYIDHRLDRERRLLEALDAGLRSEDDLLDRAWSDAPAHLRPAATLTLRAHLAKLHDDGRLPADVTSP